MNDFKSYAQNGKNDGGNAGTNGNAGQSGYGQTNGANASGGQSQGGNGQNGNLNQTVNMAAMLAKAFNGKSEGQILQTILAQAEQGKRDGTLTNSDLDAFYNALSPMLDGFKRQKLKGIIAKLKSI